TVKPPRQTLKEISAIGRRREYADDSDRVSQNVAGSKCIKVSSIASGTDQPIIGRCPFLQSRSPTLRTAKTIVDKIPTTHTGKIIGDAPAEGANQWFLDDGVPPA